MVLYDTIYGIILNPGKPSPPASTEIFGSSQTDGTATSSTDQTIFPYMYVTNPPTVTA